MVTTELPLPSTDTARLTVYSDVRNTSSTTLRGVVRATISRSGKPDIALEQPVTLGAGERREVRFDPDSYAALTVHNPDLWWPYTMGEPNLYNLHLEFRQYGRATDTDDSTGGALPDCDMLVDMSACAATVGCLWDDLGGG